jgi:hypothetical protein
LEEALDLADDPREITGQVRFAEERLRTHLKNEQDRIKAGLETDFERYLRTGQSLD